MDNQSDAAPLVVAGLYLPGISLLRSFGRRGIPAVGIDCDPLVLGFRSRYGQKAVCPNPLNQANDWVQFMRDLAKQLGRRAVLIPTSDRFVPALDAHADELSADYVFAHPSDRLLTKLTSKRDTFRLAAKFGFPIPLTCFPASEEELRAFIATAQFPCLIKPEFSKSWTAVGPDSPVYDKKVVPAGTADELSARYRQVVEIDPRVVVQEVIPGPDEFLLYFVCYMNRDQEMLGAFTGRKVRVTPIHFGSASYVQTMYDARLEEQCLAFLSSAGFWGICGIEVKQDERDGQRKLVEINPRYGLWDEIGQYIGVDIGYIAYCDLIGLPVVPAHAFQPHYRWVSLGRDVHAFLEYRREGLIDVRSWLASLRGPILWTDVSLRDWPVTWCVVRDLFLGAARRLRRVGTSKRSLLQP